VDGCSDCSLVDVLVEEITKADASAVMALSPAS
jgi:hypothetical protein